MVAPLLESGILLNQPHRGCEAPVEFGQALGSKPVDFGQSGRRGIEERPNVDALAVRSKRREIHGTAGQHVHRSVVIQPPEMKERDADLQDALIQAPHLPPLGAPQQLERFVLLEELAAIELLDAFKQRRRG